MAYIDKSNELGLMGEKIIQIFLNKNGSVVEPSINKFDNKRDLLCDGKSVEVKTQIPFIFKNSLTIDVTQVFKCRNVDELYFVTVPSAGKEYKWAGWIFKVDPKTFVTMDYTTKKGTLMKLIPIDQPSVVPVEKIKHEHIVELMKYTSSGYFNA